MFMNRVAAAGLAVMVSGAALASDGAWVASDWETSFGPMSLAVNVANDEVEGTYPKYRGRLAGTVDGNVTRIDATWLQPTAEQRCNTSLGGTHYWGTVTWYFSGPLALTGDWAYCNGPNVGRWDARLVGGVHPAQAMGR